MIKKEEYKKLSLKEKIELLTQLKKEEINVLNAMSDDIASDEDSSKNIKKQKK